MRVEGHLAGYLLHLWMCQPPSYLLPSMFQFCFRIILGLSILPGFLLLSKNLGLNLDLPQRRSKPILLLLIMSVGSRNKLDYSLTVFLVDKSL